VNEAFDAMVLILAIKAPLLKEVKPPPDVLSRADVIERCASVVNRAETVRVCAVAWLEARRFASPAEQAALDIIEGRAHIDPIDASVVARAVALQQKRIQQWKVPICVKCGNPAGAKPCPECGLSLSEKTRFNDYLIAAAAEVDPQITVLYTTDSNVLSMQPDLRVKVVSPPSQSGPLFEKVEAPITLQATATPKKKQKG
jgi:hypothetical protein